MKRLDRSLFYQILVRDPDLAHGNYTIAQSVLHCADCKRDTMHYVDALGSPPACSECIAQSRTMAKLGARGGRNGGKSRSVRKLEALERNSRNRWAKK